MPKSFIPAFNWYDEPYPAELVGAVAVFITDTSPAGTSISSVLTYCGSSVFHCLPSCTRQYDLDGWHKVGPYIRAIAERCKSGGNAGVSHIIIPAQTGGLKLADHHIKALAGLPRVWPTVWANAHYNDPNVKKGPTVGSTKVSDDDDLVAMLTGAAGGKTAGSTPATEPPTPEPRVAEGDPTNATLPPHRRSVLRNLRKPDEYIASLVK